MIEYTVFQIRPFVNIDCILQHFQNCSQWFDYNGLVFECYGIQLFNMDSWWSESSRLRIRSEVNVWSQIPTAESNFRDWIPGSKFPWPNAWMKCLRPNLSDGILVTESPQLTTLNWKIITKYLSPKTCDKYLQACKCNDKWYSHTVCAVNTQTCLNDNNSFQIYVQDLRSVWAEINTKNFFAKGVLQSEKVIWNQRFNLHDLYAKKFHKLCRSWKWFYIAGILPVMLCNIKMLPGIRTCVKQKTGNLMFWCETKKTSSKMFHVKHFGKLLYNFAVKKENKREKTVKT